MAKIKQDIGKLFSNNSDCTTGYYNGKRLINKAAMTKQKFIEVVNNLLAEREANQANLEKANFSVSNNEVAVCLAPKHLRAKQTDC